MAKSKPGLCRFGQLLWCGARARLAAFHMIPAHCHFWSLPHGDPASQFHLQGRAEGLGP